jgi:acetaldehyde dehydrogenase/alcohol dehydrogenase
VECWSSGATARRSAASASSSPWTRCSTHGIPRSLADAGIQRAEFEAALPELARAAFEDPSLRTNPRIPLVRELVELLEAAWRGR